MTGSAPKSGSLRCCGLAWSGGGGSDGHSIDQIRAVFSEIAPKNLSHDLDFVVAGFQADQLDQPVEGQRDRAAQPDVGIRLGAWAVDGMGPVLMAHRNEDADPNSAKLRIPQLVRVP